MTQYSIYLEGVSQVMDLDPGTTLGSVRQMLGSSSDDYDFVYYNPFTEQKTILNDRTLEGRKHIKDIAFNDTTVIMTVVQGSKTDLFGMKQDWLYNRHMGVQVSLNQGAEAQAVNSGKFEPVMLTDIQPSNSNSNVFYQNAVICEKGSIVRFDISSWGAAGFGYSITSDKETICDSLYIVYGDDPARQGYGGLTRYEDSNNTIQIDSTEQLQIPTSDVIHYQKVTVKTWRVTGYQKNGQTYQNNSQPPEIQAPTAHNFRAFAADAAPTGGFDPGAPGGNTFVPGGSIQTGAPGRGPTTNDAFGSITNLTEDDRNTTVLGSVVFYFFVFKDHEAANRVINVLNAPDPNAFG